VCEASIFFERSNNCWLSVILQREAYRDYPSTKLWDRIDRKKSEKKENGITVDMYQ
jgi:hypothetical protein